MKTNILHYVFGTFILLLLIIAFGSVAKAQNLESERQLFKQINPSQPSAFEVGEVVNFQNLSFLFSVWTVNADGDRLTIEPKIFLVPGNKFSILSGSNKIGVNIVFENYVYLVSGNYEVRVQLCVQVGDPCGSFSKDPVYIVIVDAEVLGDEKAIEKTEGAIYEEMERIRSQAVEEVEVEVKEKSVFRKLLDMLKGLFTIKKDRVLAQECAELQRILGSTFNRLLYAQPLSAPVVIDTVNNFASQFAERGCLGSEDLASYLSLTNEPTIRETCEALDLSNCEQLDREIVMRRGNRIPIIQIQTKKEYEIRQEAFREELRQLKDETSTINNINEE